MERDDQACPWAGRRLAVTLQWPPAPPEHLEVSQTWAQPEPPGDDTRADGISLALPDPLGAGLSDPPLIDGLARAVHDQRYGLGPVTAYLRDPQVEKRRRQRVRSGVAELT
jgi:hypothetical protein